MPPPHVNYTIKFHIHENSLRLFREIDFSWFFGFSPKYQYCFMINRIWVYGGKEWMVYMSRLFHYCEFNWRFHSNKSSDGDGYIQWKKKGWMRRKYEPHGGCYNLTCTFLLTPLITEAASVLWPENQNRGTAAPGEELAWQLTLNRCSQHNNSYGF